MSANLRKSLDGPALFDGDELGRSRRLAPIGSERLDLGDQLVRDVDPVERSLRPHPQASISGETDARLDEHRIKKVLESTTQIGSLVRWVDGDENL